MNHPKDHSLFGLGPGLPGKVFFSTPGGLPDFFHQQYDSLKYSTVKIDGAPPPLPWMSWFIMAPKTDRHLLKLAYRHLLSLRCICCRGMFLLVVFQIACLEPSQKTFLFLGEVCLKFYSLRSSKCQKQNTVGNSQRDPTLVIVRQYVARTHFAL